MSDPPSLFPPPPTGGGGFALLRGRLITRVGCTRGRPSPPPPAAPPEPSPAPTLGTPPSPPMQMAPAHWGGRGLHYTSGEPLKGGGPRGGGPRCFPARVRAIRPPPRLFWSPLRLIPPPRVCFLDVVQSRPRRRFGPTGTPAPPPFAGLPSCLAFLFSASMLLAFCSVGGFPTRPRCGACGHSAALQGGPSPFPPPPAGGGGLAP